MTARHSDQRGGALFAVTLVGLVITMAFALFMGGTAVVEERAVEASLAQARVYWAQTGNFHYALSRIAYSRLCDSGCGGNTKHTDLAIVLQAYFNELSGNALWTYADEAPAYSFTTSVAASADDTPGRQTFSGYLMATSSYLPSALLAKSSAKLPLMELRLCVGLSSANSKCGAINHNNGGNITRYYSINRLTNLPSP